MRTPEDIDSALQSASRERAGALMTLPGGFTGFYQKRIVDLAAKSRLPGIYPNSFFVEDGGLISYASDPLEGFTRAATYVDKILKGAKPAELPVQQPTKFELMINLKTAKTNRCNDSAECACAGGQGDQVIWVFDRRLARGPETH
jgi:putative tryptophan/tyrosine transport system substrate-binding protein